MTDLRWLPGRPVAHRGLHSPGIPENTLAACREAIRNGYTVGRDARRTRDGVLVVFHDQNLLRMIGLDRIVEECSSADLQHVSLAGTGERIPSLAIFLETAGCLTGLPALVRPHGKPG